MTETHEKGMFRTLIDSRFQFVSCFGFLISSLNDFYNRNGIIVWSTNRLSKRVCSNGLKTH